MYFCKGVFWYCYIDLHVLWSEILFSSHVLTVGVGMCVLHMSNNVSNCCFTYHLWVSFAWLATSGVKWRVYGYHKRFDIYYLAQTIDSQKLCDCNKLNYYLHAVHLYACQNAVNSSMWIHHAVALLSGVLQALLSPIREVAYWIKAVIHDIVS